ncbi:hypothetical protein GCM10009539_06190 [Cryptosporangium japonicum]|uniref:Uncharacterized protein n=1 Tax=Cryptosporangium japonicum TaxID=80872 RepID=A0ABN0TK50_9ACTN
MGGHVRQRGSAPEGQRLAVERRGFVGTTVADGDPRRVHPLVKDVGVQLTGFDAEPVSVGVRDDPVLAVRTDIGQSGS